MGKKDKKKSENTEIEQPIEGEEPEIGEAQEINNQNQNQNAAELPTAIEQVKLKEPVVGHLIGTKVAVR